MKILYVDDETDIRTIASMALKHAKHEVILCESGVEALAIGPAILPDIILLDVMMPELDGPMTLAKLREIPELSSTPIIFISAKVQKGEVTQYLEMGAIGVINKPFDPLTLGKNIDAIWTNWKSEKSV